jgi:hypothetical protein
MTGPRCSYPVQYPGAAEDFPRLIDDYPDHHPQIMKHFPGSGRSRSGRGSFRAAPWPGRASNTCSPTG